MTEIAMDPHKNLAHHFDDMEQQKESATLGMWLFLITEIMLFGAIFLGNTALRYSYYESFSAASGHLYVSLGTINTVVLLTSSLMMVLAVHAAHEGDAKRIVRYLLLTIGLGVVFLGIKLTEYSIDYREGLIPLDGWWKRQAVDARTDQGMKLFFTFYFVMTLLHAIHMIIGMVLLGFFAWKAKRQNFSRYYYVPIDVIGLYWHFVDIVWVFLFPTLYLVHPELHFMK